MTVKMVQFQYYILLTTTETLWKAVKLFPRRFQYYILLTTTETYRKAKISNAESCFNTTFF